MPKAPDPQLSERIAKAALRLLDEGGPKAVTMRSVATQAGIAITTIYERFADRDALLQAVVALAQSDLIKTVQSARSVDAFVKTYIRFFCQYPHRYAVSMEAFYSRLASGEPMPVMGMFKQLLARQTGLNGSKLNDRTLAIAALTFGSLESMIAVGPDCERANDLRRACLSAIRRLTKPAETKRG